MEPFRGNVFYLLLWRAILALLVAVVLMATRRGALSQALLLGAHVALLFSLCVVAWTRGLDAGQLARFLPWRMLADGERPAGVAARRWACNVARETALPFAKAASAVAVCLAASSLMLAGE